VSAAKAKTIHDILVKLAQQTDGAIKALDNDTGTYGNFWKAGLICVATQLLVAFGVSMLVAAGVIGGAKGAESQTRKLFEVCHLRGLPILTFCNKMDRESRDTFDIIDEIQENLVIDVTPASRPIGMGRDFVGCY